MQMRGYRPLQLGRLRSITCKRCSVCKTSSVAGTQGHGDRIAAGETARTQQEVQRQLAIALTISLGLLTTPVTFPPDAAFARGTAAVQVDRRLLEQVLEAQLRSRLETLSDDELLTILEAILRTSREAAPGPVQEPTKASAGAGTGTVSKPATTPTTAATTPAAPATIKASVSAAPQAPTPADKQTASAAPGSPASQAAVGSAVTETTGSTGQQTFGEGTEMAPTKSARPNAGAAQKDAPEVAKPLPTAAASGSQDQMTKAAATDVQQQDEQPSAAAAVVKDAEPVAAANGVGTSDSKKQEDRGLVSGGTGPNRSAPGALAVTAAAGASTPDSAEKEGQMPAQANAAVVQSGEASSPPQGAGVGAVVAGSAEGSSQEAAAAAMEGLNSMLQQALKATGLSVEPSTQSADQPSTTPALPLAGNAPSPSAAATAPTTNGTQVAATAAKHDNADSKSSAAVKPEAVSGAAAPQAASASGQAPAGTNGIAPTVPAARAGAVTTNGSIAPAAERPLATASQPQQSARLSAADTVATDAGWPQTAPTAASQLQQQSAAQATVAKVTEDFPVAVAAKATPSGSGSTPAAASTGGSSPDTAGSSSAASVPSIATGQTSTPAVTSSSPSPQPATAAGSFVPPTVTKSEGNAAALSATASSSSSTSQAVKTEGSSSRTAEVSVAVTAQQPDAGMAGTKSNPSEQLNRQTPEKQAAAEQQAVGSGSTASVRDENVQGAGSKSADVQIVSSKQLKTQGQADAAAAVDNAKSEASAAAVTMAPQQARAAAPTDNKDTVSAAALKAVVPPSGGEVTKTVVAVGGVTTPPSEAAAKSEPTAAPSPSPPNAASTSQVAAVSDGRAGSSSSTANTDGQASVKHAAPVPGVQGTAAAVVDIDSGGFRKENEVQVAVTAVEKMPEDAAIEDDQTALLLRAAGVQLPAGEVGAAQGASTPAPELSSQVNALLRTILDRLPDNPALKEELRKLLPDLAKFDPNLQQYLPSLQAAWPDLEQLKEALTSEQLKEQVSQGVQGAVQGAASLPKTLSDAPETINRTLTDSVEGATQLSRSMAQGIQSKVDFVRRGAQQAENALQPVITSAQSVGRGVQQLARGDLNKINKDTVAGAAAIIAVAGLPLLYLAIKGKQPSGKTGTDKATGGNDTSVEGDVIPPPPLPPTANDAMVTAKNGQPSLSTPPPVPRKQNVVEPVIAEENALAASVETVRATTEALRANKVAMLQRMGIAGRVPSPESEDPVGTSFGPAEVGRVMVNGTPARAMPTDAVIGTSFEGTRALAAGEGDGSGKVLWRRREPPRSLQGTDPTRPPPQVEPRMPTRVPAAQESIGGLPSKARYQIARDAAESSFAAAQQQLAELRGTRVPSNLPEGVLWRRNQPPPDLPIQGPVERRASVQAPAKALEPASAGDTPLWTRKEAPTGQSDQIPVNAVWPPASLPRASAATPAAQERLAPVTDPWRSPRGSTPASGLPIANELHSTWAPSAQDQQATVQEAQSAPAPNDSASQEGHVEGMQQLELNNGFIAMQDGEAPAPSPAALSMKASGTATSTGSSVTDMQSEQIAAAVETVRGDIAGASSKASGGDTADSEQGINDSGADSHGQLDSGATEAPEQLKSDAAEGIPVQLKEVAAVPRDEVDHVQARDELIQSLTAEEQQLPVLGAESGFEAANTIDASPVIQEGDQDGGVSEPEAVAAQAETIDYDRTATDGNASRLEFEQPQGNAKVTALTAKPLVAQGGEGTVALKPSVVSEPPDVNRSNEAHSSLMAVSAAAATVEAPGTSAKQVPVQMTASSPEQAELEALLATAQQLLMALPADGLPRERQVLAELARELVALRENNNTLDGSNRAQLAGLAARALEAAQAVAASVAVQGPSRGLGPLEAHVPRRQEPVSVTTEAAVVASANGVQQGVIVARHGLEQEEATVAVVGVETAAEQSPMQDVGVVVDVAAETVDEPSEAPGSGTVTLDQEAPTANAVNGVQQPVPNAIADEIGKGQGFVPQQEVNGVIEFDNIKARQVGAQQDTRGLWGSSTDGQTQVSKEEPVKLWGSRAGLQERDAAQQQSARWGNFAGIEHNGSKEMTSMPGADIGREQGRAAQQSSNNIWGGSGNGQQKPLQPESVRSVANNGSNQGSTALWGSSADASPSAPQQGPGEDVVEVPVWISKPDDPGFAAALRRVPVPATAAQGPPSPALEGRAEAQPLNLAGNSMRSNGSGAELEKQGTGRWAAAMSKGPSSSEGASSMPDNAVFQELRAQVAQQLGNQGWKGGSQ